MKREIIEKLSLLITSAFGLVAALAWNSAVQAVFKNVFGEAQGVAPMIVYAAAVTVIAVAVTLWLGRVSERLKK